MKDCVWLICYLKVTNKSEDGLSTADKFSLSDEKSLDCPFDQ